MTMSWSCCRGCCRCGGISTMNSPLGAQATRRCRESLWTVKFRRRRTVFDRGAVQERGALLGYPQGQSSRRCRGVYDGTNEERRALLVYAEPTSPTRSCRNVYDRKTIEGCCWDTPPTSASRRYAVVFGGSCVPVAKDNQGQPKDNQGQARATEGCHEFGPGELHVNYVLSCVHNEQ